ncbi:helix-turn-helix domain-containing protein [Salinarimonas sp. NSM]|uniref:helix-turn-helix domain-containing protein n=1 Tax=Salinarimonas TaxID=690086 RepID=UPI0035573EB2
MLTCGMIKAGRDLVGWTQADLAARAGVSLPTIQRMEDPTRGPLRSSAANVERVRGAFAQGGISFALDDARITISLAVPR